MTRKFIALLFTVTIALLGNNLRAAFADEIYDFHVAVERCDTDKIKAFLKKNPKLIEAKVGRGFRPLHKAALTGRKDIVELLISNGADINSRDNQGQTPLVWAISEGTLDVIKLLVDRGANVNIKTNSGVSPLKCAMASCTNKEIADFLRKHGARE